MSADESDLQIIEMLLPYRTGWIPARLPLFSCKSYRLLSYDVTIMQMLFLTKCFRLHMTVVKGIITANYGNYKEIIVNRNSRLSKTGGIRMKSRRNNRDFY